MLGGPFDASWWSVQTGPTIKQTPSDGNIRKEMEEVDGGSGCVGENRRNHDINGDYPSSGIAQIASEDRCLSCCSGGAIVAGNSYDCAGGRGCGGDAGCFPACDRGNRDKTCDNAEGAYTCDSGAGVSDRFSNRVSIPVSNGVDVDVGDVEAGFDVCVDVAPGTCGLKSGDGGDGIIDDCVMVDDGVSGDAHVCDRVNTNGDADYKEVSGDHGCFVHENTCLSEAGTVPGGTERVVACRHRAEDYHCKGAEQGNQEQYSGTGVAVRPTNAEETQPPSGRGRRRLVDVDSLSVRGHPGGMGEGHLERPWQATPACLYLLHTVGIWVQNPDEHVLFDLSQVWTHSRVFSP